MFDLQSALLHLYAAVIASIDPSRGVAAAQIQCRLAPLIPAIQVSLFSSTLPPLSLPLISPLLFPIFIPPRYLSLSLLPLLLLSLQDSAALYDLVFKLMKALHAGKQCIITVLYNVSVPCVFVVFPCTHTHTHTHPALPADTLSGHRDRFNRQYHA